MVNSPFRSILIPTDFSECASWAVESGFQLADRFGASVHLIHVVVPSIMGEALLPRQKAWLDERNELAQKQLAQLGKGYEHLSITKEVLTGSLYQSVSTYADEHGIDLIVIGSHGASGKSEYLIGSNTQRVVRKSHCPVLVIKNPLRDTVFDRVLFASRFYTEELPAFRYFLEIVRPFLPEIHLVEVHTGSIFNPLAMVSHEAMRDFKREAGSLKCEIHLQRDFSADRGIRELAAEVEADLIAISNHHRHPLKRMLTGSTVETLINHAEIPVLSIDFKD